MSNVQISVVMGVRNEAGHIEELLADIAAQNLPKDQFEVIIADGESDDGTDDIIAHWMAEHPEIQAQLLHNSKRWQYPGVNMCIRQAQGKAMLVLDGHARIPVDFLSNNLEVLEKSGAGVVGGFWDTQGADSTWGKAIEGALSSWFGVGSARFRNASGCIGKRWAQMRIWIFSSESIRPDLPSIWIAVSGPPTLPVPICSRLPGRCFAMGAGSLPI